ncbi:hypothetical protein IHE44_0011914 [Lamprotornis superbus]|uniref:Uncharacterized protein n=1 Tax=Lamprotornis superbus TaxID=245042 RepID=A0A835TYP8_9PASS|nr:hypothetical protein IHE44_0011914 [Lamprotornis superbus]
MHKGLYGLAVLTSFPGVAEEPFRTGWAPMQRVGGSPLAEDKPRSAQPRIPGAFLRSRALRFPDLLWKKNQIQNCFVRDATCSYQCCPSSTDHHSVFVSEVLVGDLVQGNHDYSYLPTRPEISNRLLNSLVDNEKNPSIFVIFEKHQIYLAYNERPSQMTKADLQADDPETVELNFTCGGKKKSVYERPLCEQKAPKESATLQKGKVFAIITNLLPDGLSHFVLIEVDKGTVNVAVTSVDGNLHRLQTGAFGITSDLCPSNELHEAGATVAKLRLTGTEQQGSAERSGELKRFMEMKNHRGFIREDTWRHCGSVYADKA